MNKSNVGSSNLIEKNVLYVNTTIIVLLGCVKCCEEKLPCPLVLIQWLPNVPFRGVRRRFPGKETFGVTQER